jgi:hypothetical protein
MTIIANEARRVLDTLTLEQAEVLHEAVMYGCHFFDTCAEIGVQPTLQDMAQNIVEIASDYLNPPPESAVRAYVAADWDNIRAACFDDSVTFDI